MGDPLPRMDAGGSALGASTPLADAASRLDRALDILEAAFRQPAHDAGPVVDDLAPAAAARPRELEAAAAAASVALGHAMAEVRRLLHDDPGAPPDGGVDQDLFDFPLESDPRLLDDSDDALAELAPDPDPDPDPNQEPDKDPAA